MPLAYIYAKLSLLGFPFVTTAMSAADTAGAMLPAAKNTLHTCFCSILSTFNVLDVGIRQEAGPEAIGLKVLGPQLSACYTSHCSASCP